MKNIFNILCKPKRVYRVTVVFVSAIIIYAIVYNEELSAGDESRIDLDETSEVKERRITFSAADDIKGDDEEHKSDSEILNTKYILFWTPNVTPLNLIKEEGQKAFISNGCKYTNCFITQKKQYLSDQSKYDAIIFSIAALSDLQELPKERSLRQKFVATSIDPPEKYPVVNPYFDGYFNWTWTYRLDSDILWRYFRIYNSKGKEVGPKKGIKWSKIYVPGNSDYILDDIGIALGSKNKAVMWIKSCNHINQVKYIADLERELFNFGLSLDTYSNCSTGYNNCGSKATCNNRIAKHYYFYLAFEDYIDEDYVTNKLLFAVQNLVVPIVMGNTNYSRFLPPGSYLDAKYLSASVLAAFIDDSIGNYSIFRKYFNWFKHYNYKSSLKSEVCNLCTTLNRRKMVDKFTVYDHFRKTWSGEKSVLISNFLFGVFKNDESLNALARNGNYVDIRRMFKEKHLLKQYDIGNIIFESRVSLNFTTTEETNFIPFELTTEN